MRKFDALVKRLNIDIKANELKVARLERAVFEANRKGKTTPYKLIEFLDKELFPEDEIFDRKANSERLLNFIIMLNSALGGKDLRKKK